MGFSLGDLNPLPAIGNFTGMWSGGGGAGGLDDQGQEREKQLQWLQTLQQAASGQAPSAAQAMFQSGIGRLQAQQQSIAASQPGMSPAASARMASIGSAAVGQGMLGQQAAQRAQEQANARAMYTQALGGMRGQDIQNRQINQEQHEANQKAWGEGIKGAGQGLAMFSDRRLKTDIADGGAAAGEFLDALKASTYRYKDPTGPGKAPGPRLGVMAQDLERSELGRGLVRDTPQGKAVDVGQGLGAALAAAAHLNDRLKRLESREAA